MFRTMRRSRQQLTTEECLHILTTGSYGVLALSGDDGYPYTVPLNYVYSNGKLYFHCAREGHKIDALQRCSKASFCVVAASDVVPEKITTYFRSVIVFGRVKLSAEEAQVKETAVLLGEKYCSDFRENYLTELAECSARMSCFELTIENMTGKEAIELTQQRQTPAQ